MSAKSNASPVPPGTHPVARLTELTLRTFNLADKKQLPLLKAVSEVDFLSPAPPLDVEGNGVERINMELAIDLFDAAEAHVFEGNATDRGVTLDSPHIQTPYPLGLCATKNIAFVIAAAVGQGGLEKGVDPIIGLDSKGRPVGLVESMLFSQMPDFKTVRLALSMDDEEFQRVVTRAEARFSISPDPFLMPSATRPQRLSFSFTHALLEGASISYALWSRMELRCNQLVEDMAVMYGPKDHPNVTRAMQLLLDAGFPIGHALHRACEQVRPDLVRLLLTRGADPEERDRNEFLPREIIGSCYGSRGSRGRVPKAIVLMLDATLARKEALEAVTSMKEGSQPTARCKGASC